MHHDVQEYYLVMHGDDTLGCTGDDTLGCTGMTKQQCIDTVHGADVMEMDISTVAHCLRTGG